MSSLFLSALANTRVYPLTDRQLSGLPHAEQVSLMAQAGVTLVQLREKSLSPRTFYQEAEAALHVAHERGVKIIINDRVDLALALEADGVHLGQDDVPPQVARALLGSQAIIGFSTHDLRQAEAAANMPIDYIAVGPIFPTSTKQGSSFSVGLEGLSRIRKAIANVPIVAIGGITSENGAQVMAAGADALALISDIWSSPDQAIVKTKRLVHTLLS